MRVRVYTRQGCPYSEGARRLLREKGIPFDDIDVTDSPERRAEMERASGGARTLPQIFFGDRHVGGFSDLQELDRTRGLRDAGTDEDAHP